MGNEAKISILGSGWLGLPLAKLFVDQGSSVKASTRSVNRFNPIQEIGAEPFKIDIENLSSNIDELLTAKILIINITSKSVEAFKELILRIEESPIENVLFISSTSVYRNLNHVVSEVDGLHDIDSLLYKIENLFRYNIHFETTVVRFAGLVGYSRHPGKWFVNKPVSQPDAPVNLIHRDDCIGIIEAIVKQQAWGEVFNACSTEHPTKREFYTHARKLLGLHAPEFSEKDELKFKIVNNEKVIRKLGYVFKYSNPNKFKFD